MLWSKKAKKFDLAKAYHESLKVYGSVPFVKRRRRYLFLISAIKAVSYVMIGIFLLLTVTALSYVMVAKKTYENAVSGKEKIDNALFYAKQADYDTALSFADEAQFDFNTAYAEYQKVKNSFLFSRTPILKDQLDNFNYLLFTAETLAGSVYESVAFTKNLNSFIERNNTSFSKFSPDEKREFLSYIYQSGPELISLKRKLDLASENLKKVKFPQILSPVNEKVAELDEQVDQAKFYVDRAIPASKILPEIMGYPKKNTFLFLLQNSNELRPTGGFIGTYGVVETENGDIGRFDTHDIYHLDMPVKDKVKVKPPEPLRKYLGIPDWYMRDANWSPDYPTSARQVEWFYQKENSLQEKPDPATSFDGIIAVTPEFITDLLAVTGPITIGNDRYTKDNFTDLLEYKVEKDYIQLGIPKWNRKEVIGDLAKELKLRLFDLDSGYWPQIIYVINENISKKNILLHFNDQDLENLAIAQGLAGEMKMPSSDYLMIVDSNMASIKTDAVMNRSIDYTLEVTDEGPMALLQVRYAHKGTFDYKTTRYRTYARIYVPDGSELINAKGHSEGDVIVTKELGKTVFEAFVVVEPGNIGTLSLLYRLPPKVKEKITSGTYNLYVQKQPGSKVDELNVDVQLANKIRSLSPTGFFVEKKADNEIKWKTDLLADREFEIITK